MNLKTLDNKALVEHLKTLVTNQKHADIDILLCIREVLCRRLDLMAGFANIAEYCEEVFGMSQESAWKKARAAKIIGPYPKLLEMLRQGKTHISHVAMAANRITQANQDEIYRFLPGASRRDLQFFLERLQPDGSFSKVEPTIEVKFRITQRVLDKLDHARGLIAKSGTGSSDQARLLEEALDALLDKRDPAKKAERAERRKQKIASVTRASALYPKTTKATKVTKSSGTSSSEQRPPIPAATKHEVYRRFGGQCAYVGMDGRRCAERSLLHIDHIKPWALGGTHELENLRLLCRSHNSFEAERMMGVHFMATKRKVQRP